MPHISTISFQGPRKEASGTGLTGGIDIARLEDPKTIAGIRKQTLLKLAEPLALPEDSSYGVMRDIASGSTSADGRLHVRGVTLSEPECSPDEETMNSVMRIGFQNSPGTLDVAFSPALGLRWRTSPDHPASALHPQLAMFEAPDTPRQESPKAGDMYVRPLDLHTAMLSVPDAASMGDNLYRFLQSLPRYQLIAVPSHIYDGRWLTMTRDDAFSSFGIDIFPPDYDFKGMKSQQLLASLRFLLHGKGLKIVDVSHMRVPEQMKEGPERDLVQAATDIAWQNRLYMESEKITA